MELEGDYTSRLALTEELKSYPYGAMWDEFCERQNVPVREDWINVVKEYEKEVLMNRV